MKYIYSILLLALLSGCNRFDKLKIDGTAPGLPNGVFGILDEEGKTLFAENIVNSTFKLDQILEHPGFYTVKITNMANTKDYHAPYEMYFENGNYTVELNGKDLSKYPKVTSESKIQNELSYYYGLADKEAATLTEKVEKETDFMQSAAAKKLSPDEHMARLKQLKIDQDKADNIKATLVELFVQKYPESEITPHLIKQLEYKDDPTRFYAIYNKLSQAAKETKEGKELGEILGRLVKVVPGATAPDIYGTDPEGKPFDKTKRNKKVYLIDFWRAGNRVSRDNHALILQRIFFQVNDRTGFGVISVNMDEKKDWWLNAMKEDNIEWPQYSELKGNDSKTAEAWCITRIPTYYLVDSHWKILKRDIKLDDVTFKVEDYLGK